MRAPGHIARHPPVSHPPHRPSTSPVLRGDDGSAATESEPNRPSGREGRGPRPPAVFPGRPAPINIHASNLKSKTLETPSNRVRRHPEPAHMINMQLEYYDMRAEELRLRSLQYRLERSEREGLAVQAALSEHPVTAYVKSLPIESPEYPAIEYLRLAEQVGVSVEDVFRRFHPDMSTHENGQDRIQETVRETIQKTSLGTHQGSGQKRCTLDDLPYNPGNVQEDDPFEGLIDLSLLSGNHAYISWCMPAHDLQRPRDKGCGFIRSRNGGLAYTACPTDPEHHCKGKRIHCWSLRCPDCMNDTSLRQAVKVERQLLTYKALCRKQGRDVGDIGHWVVSPPQDVGRSLMQTKAEFDELESYVNDSMQSYGALAGVTFFHPWRQGETEWRLAPHFHILCYGRIDTTSFRKANPGWVIKKVHPRERIRSIRHTAAYLMTHMGLGIAEKDPDEVDWDLDFLDHMIPGLKSSGASYRDSDHEDRIEGKGRMVGDISDIDWTDWAKDRLTAELRIRYWGGVSRNNIRTIGFHRQYRIRVCKECGELLRTYDGIDDSQGSYVRYIQDNPVMAFSRDYDTVQSSYLGFKDRLRSEGLTIVDFAAMIPFAVSSLELGLPDNGDLVTAGPFEEPDQYFLRRQEMAIGEDIHAVAGGV